MPSVEELATQFEAVTAEALQVLEASDESQWQNTSGEEGWTAAALAQHFASGIEPIVGLVQGVAMQAQMPGLTMEMLDAQNAENAKANAAASKADVIATLKKNTEAALATLRQLSDADLQQSAEVLPDTTMTAEQVAQGILIGHVQGHLASFKSTLG